MAMNKVGNKKSLFKKPAWASTSTSAVTDSDSPIFGQTHLYQEIVEDEKRRRDRHAAKQKEIAEKKLEKEREHVPKRRRISNEPRDRDCESDEDGDIGKSSRSQSADSQRSKEDATSRKEQNPRVLRSTPQKVKSGTKRTNILASPSTRKSKASSREGGDLIIIDGENYHQALSGREESELYAAPRPKTAKSKPIPKTIDSESESEEDDEYLRELKAKAREEARLKGLSSTAEKDDKTPLQTVPATKEAPSPGTSDAVQPSDKLDERSFRATSIPEDSKDEVKIWIKTIIPGAREVIVSRKIGQPLDKVKEFWVKRNELDPVIAAKVFFTWNGTRLYNSTTMRGIIEHLKKSHPQKDGADPSGGNIVIEAVTDEIFEYRQKQKADKAAEAEGSAGDETQSTHHHQSIEGAGEADEAAAQPQKTGIIIKLKAQDMDELNLRVRPNTAMRRIIQGFCKFKRIDPNQHKEQWLSYDGEKLDADATVEEVGFEHDDTVEVYLR